MPSLLSSVRCRSRVFFCSRNTSLFWYLIRLCMELRRQVRNFRPFCARISVFFSLKRCPRQHPDAERRPVLPVEPMTPLRSHWRGEQPSFSSSLIDISPFPHRSRRPCGHFKRRHQPLLIKATAGSAYAGKPHPRFLSRIADQRNAKPRNLTVKYAGPSRARGSRMHGVRHIPTLPIRAAHWSARAANKKGAVA